MVVMVEGGLGGGGGGGRRGGREGGYNLSLRRIYMKYQKNSIKALKVIIIDMNSMKCYATVGNWQTFMIKGPTINNTAKYQG